MRGRNYKSPREVITSRSPYRPPKVDSKIRKARQEDLLAFAELLYDMYEEKKRHKDIKSEHKNG